MLELIDFLIVRPVINILFIVYNFVGDFGLAIIVFTVIVKFLTWPLMKKQLHHSKAIKKIQPELAEIRKRCNGNKQLESIQMMALYKKHNIKAFGSFWILLIQIPIFFALFLAIRVMTIPTVKDNLQTRAYAPVSSLERINQVIDLQKKFLENPDSKYEFKPKLFNTVDLSARAGFKNISEIFVLCFALGAAVLQYISSRQLTNNKSSFKASWKRMVSDAKAGKDPDQNEINQMVSSQMSFMMPLMMLMVTINLPGALCFYYAISNFISTIQQRIILNKVDDELDDNADKTILKELKDKTKKIQEAEIIENKKTGTKITRIKAKDAKIKTKKNLKHKQSNKG